MVTNRNVAEDALIDLPGELIHLVWGNQIDSSIFERWSQAFEFSADECSALIQYEGGPCSVLTTVQAHLLNELIFCQRYGDQWRSASPDEIDLHFLNALRSILHLVAVDDQQILLAQFPSDKQTASLSAEEFHRHVRFSVCRSNVDLKQQIFAGLRMWKSSYGVLLFLYSCLMTKTVQMLKKEIDDETSLPLIDVAHGHASQCLTNLLITGHATPHCFDGEKDISGLKLYGIRQQASIGFLSTLEMYRLMEVGWFLKNPRSPIWILGSETHLTVIFSRVQSLVELEVETPVSKALKIFHAYDTEKNGFIANCFLEQVINEMVASFIVKRTRSIDELRERMDPEHMQIIMESSFLHEFFPEDLARRTNNEQLGPSNGQAFVLYHYNGLPRSNKDKRVRYASARAVISDYGYGNDIPSSAVQPVQAGSYLPITGVLRTKWATIDLKWDDEMKPSLN